MNKVLALLLSVIVLSGYNVPLDTGQVLIHNPGFDEYQGQALITFSYDDGYRSIYDNALPLHEEYKIPATFNIIASYIGLNPERHMDERMILDAYNRGIEIASHSYYHNDWLTNKTDEEVHFEFRESKRILSGIVGEINTVAIPFSQYDDRVMEIAKEHYIGVRISGGNLNEMPPENPYAINSALATLSHTTFEDVKELIDRAVAKKKWIMIMLHGVNYDYDSMYDITPDLLDEILEYVAAFDSKDLLPINTVDAILYGKRLRGITGVKANP